MIGCADPQSLSPGPLIYAGIGLRRAAGTATVLAALDQALQEAGRDRSVLAALASHPDRMTHPALQQAAAAIAVPLLDVGVDALARQTTLTRSPQVQDRLQLGSVAEAAALAACATQHRHCRLLAPRMIDQTRLVTVALATADATDFSHEEPS